MMDGDGSGWLVGFAVLTLVLLLFALLAVLANLFLHVSRKSGPGRSAAEVAGRRWQRRTSRAACSTAGWRVVR